MIKAHSIDHYNKWQGSIEDLREVCTYYLAEMTDVFGVEKVNTEDRNLQEAMLREFSKMIEHPHCVGGRISGEYEVVKARLKHIVIKQGETLTMHIDNIRIFNVETDSVLELLRKDCPEYQLVKEGEFLTVSNIASIDLPEINISNPHVAFIRELDALIRKHGVEMTVWGDLIFDFNGSDVVLNHTDNLTKWLEGVDSSGSFNHG